MYLQYSTCQNQKVSRSEHKCTCYQARTMCDGRFQNKRPCSAHAEAEMAQVEQRTTNSMSTALPKKCCMVLHCSLSEFSLFSLFFMRFRVLNQFELRTEPHELVRVGSVQVQVQFSQLGQGSGSGSGQRTPELN